MAKLCLHVSWIDNVQFNGASKVSIEMINIIIVTIQSFQNFFTWSTPGPIIKKYWNTCRPIRTEYFSSPDPDNLIQDYSR